MANDLLRLMKQAIKQANKQAPNPGKDKRYDRLAGTMFFFNSYRKSCGIEESMDETRAWAATHLQPAPALGEGWFWMKETK